MVSVAVAASLSLINACEKNRQSEPVQKLSHAEQRGSAEGLVLAGLLALKRCVNGAKHIRSHADLKFKPATPANNQSSRVVIHSTVRPGVVPA